MEKSNHRIFDQLVVLFGKDLEDEKIREALLFDQNQRLAEVGDSVLDLVIRLEGYEAVDSSAGSMDKLRQTVGRRTRNQKVLFTDKTLTRFIIENDYPQYPPEKIGLIRSDRYMEAIIGAVFIQKGWCDDGHQGRR